MAEETRRCAHTSCQCEVSGDDDRYCSEYCREARGITELGCGCEHPTCIDQL